MNKIKKTFRDFFGFGLNSLNNLGTIQRNSLTINYVLNVDLSGNTIMDLLIFEDNIFPPVHKRINYDGKIINLENFQFSIIYETERVKKLEQDKMTIKNKKIAQNIIKKKLAKKSDKWINNYIQLRT